MTGPLIIEKEGIINARPDEVWKVIVTSEYFNQWMFVQPQIVPGKTLEDLSETENGTKIRSRLGDLSVDPEGQSWYDAYNSSDEIGAIERIIMKPDKTE